MRGEGRSARGVAESSFCPVKLMGLARAEGAAELSRRRPHKSF